MDSDPPAARPWGRQLIRTLQRIFVSGVLVVVPVTVTIYVLYFLFRKVDGLLSPLLIRYLHRDIPGLGLLATLLIIFLVGVIVRNVFGSRLFGLGELIFVRTPLVRAIYTAAKQLLEAITLPDEKSAGRAVVIEYPRPGIYTIGFAAARTSMPIDGQARQLVAVFVPSTPTPMTGSVVLVPEKEVYALSMSAESAMKYIVSGGFATPAVINRHAARAVEA